MSGTVGLRVEDALRLLPDVDALTPLRAFLISISRPPGDDWSTGEPYRTVGRRQLQLDELRRRIPEALDHVRVHLAALYDAALDALAHEQEGDLPGAVRALLRAGAREEAVGRYRAAEAWCTHAASLSEALRDRRPEIEALCALGQLALAGGRFETAARQYQRALALAEAELDDDGASAACQGLGDVSVGQGALAGAEAWYTRGLRLAERDPRRSGELLHRLGQVAGQRGDLATAAERLREARVRCDAAGLVADTAGVLCTQGTLALEAGRVAEAVSAYREGLELLGQAQPAGPAPRGGAPRLEVACRLGLARGLMEMGRWREAEDECRRAEELAIAHNLTRPLAQLYLVLGALRGRQGDEDGFVFFEKAIELSRGLEPAPTLEGHAYLEYGRFRRDHDPDQARACFERAAEIFAALGHAAGTEQVTAELATLPH